MAPDYRPRIPDIMRCSGSRRRPASIRSEAGGHQWDGESSTATWTVVWNDRLTEAEKYRPNAHRVVWPNSAGALLCLYRR